MKNRFTMKKKEQVLLREVFFPVLLFALIGALFYQGLNSLGETTEAERLRSVEAAVTKATVQCYAIEGQYPPTLGYLEDHYGLMVDRDRYIVQYSAFASNIMPTILVLPKNFTADKGGAFDEA